MPMRFHLPCLLQRILGRARVVARRAQLPATLQRYLAGQSCSVGQCVWPPYVSVEANACWDDAGVVHWKHGALRWVSWAMPQCSAALQGSCQPCLASRCISNPSSCGRNGMRRAVVRQYCYWIPRFRSIGFLGFLCCLVRRFPGRFGIVCHRAPRRDTFVFDARSNPLLRRLRTLPLYAVPPYRDFCNSP